ncbi:ribosome small subunit-dependent GTPase A [Evansella cellulosilytica]|uniref:Small ribosomal subunit biogenesis GTPase RsgA n=1 Tax=Evansella cellulosilytica (strain ATCC 21833 / DSM 2522 / FERM P-1141 / JCM 9156 / N-4) TaxID=649639 RepID=E6TY70_EVAC2|nr:ribosome small subunit-dependent GTPase A [Evansella cellulosilytica]ADU32389.1 ribosome small subunit-dependent GTPase A [Evansella cellulosilytica DSM 2522]
MTLEQYGWNKEWEQKMNDISSRETLNPGRVTEEHKGMYRVYTNVGVISCEVTGSFRYRAIEREEYPAVGDWVLVELFPSERKGRIHHILKRKSRFSRKAAGLKTDEQIVAANVDTLFIVMALNNDYNVRRLERYLTLAWESGASPVVILSKADLCHDVEKKVAEVEGVSFGVPVHVISALYDDGMERISTYMKKGKSAALIGSSGVGKSTIINALLGREVQAVQGIREDDARGRHTTTHRELFLLQEGGVLIDTPGMREIQLWESEEGLKQSFDDIQSMSLACHFRDCKHEHEPRCAIQSAIMEGTLDRHRYNSYLKLQKEQDYIEKKAVEKAKLADRQRKKEKNRRN